jgi:simple sugar transport system permease protein
VLWPLLGIAGLIAFNAAMDLAKLDGPGLFGPGAFLHLSWQNGPAGPLIDILNHGALIIILALGMTLVVATRGVDLSVGSIMAIAGAVGAVLIGRGWPGAGALGAAIVVAGLCGLWNGVLVSGLRLQPFVATLVLMVAGRGVAQMITAGQIETFNNPFLEFIGNGRPAWLPLPFPVLLAGGLFAVLLFMTRSTALGLLLEAVGGNPEAARLAGVRAGIIVAATYVCSGLCAGLAGLIAAAYIKGADPMHAGLTLELSAIFAVVVGGTPLTGGRFSLAGAVAGGMLMQTLTTTMYARDVRPDVAPLPQAAVILAVCLLGSPRARAMFTRRAAA